MACTVSIVIAFAVFISGAHCALNMCTFLPPTEDINWARLKRGPWKWVLHTDDAIQDMLKCTDVSIYTQGKGIKQTFTLEFENKFGGLYFLSGNQTARGEYHITEFTETWRHIAVLKFSQSVSAKMLSQEVEIERKGNVMFYTNYKNYFITATCLPDGRVSVAAFTRHRRVRRRLLGLVYSVLARHKVMAIPSPSRCGYVGRRPQKTK